MSVLGGLILRSGAVWQTVYTSDFSVGVDGWTGAGNSLIAGNIDGIGGQNDNLRLTANVQTVDAAVRCDKSGILATATDSRMSFDFYIPSSNISVVGLRVINQGPELITEQQSPTLDVWNSIIEAEFSSGGTTGVRVFQLEAGGDNLIPSSSNGDVIYIRNVLLEQFT